MSNAYNAVKASAIAGNNACYNYVNMHELFNRIRQTAKLGHTDTNVLFNSIEDRDKVVALLKEQNYNVTIQTEWCICIQWSLNLVKQKK